MSKYIYQTVYEEFTGLKPPEPTDTKQRRKRGYGHPYRMRLNMQETAEERPKKPERRNQFGQPINGSRKPRDEQPRFEASSYEPSYKKPAHDKPRERELPPQFRAGNAHREDTMTMGQLQAMEEPAQRKQSSAMPKVTYKKRRRFSVEEHPETDAQS